MRLVCHPPRHQRHTEPATCIQSFDSRRIDHTVHSNWHLQPTPIQKTLLAETSGTLFFQAIPILLSKDQQLHINVLPMSPNTCYPSLQSQQQRHGYVENCSGQNRSFFYHERHETHEKAANVRVASMRFFRVFRVFRGQPGSRPKNHQETQRRMPTTAIKVLSIAPYSA